LDQSGHWSASAPLPLVAHGQRDDDHVAVLKFDQRFPKIIHSGRAVLEADANSAPKISTALGGRE
jgi:hypothetical protein